MDSRQADVDLVDDRRAGVGRRTNPDRKGDAILVVYGPIR
jgi:hypothetical protein